MRLYVTKFTRAECVVGTYFFCLMIGRWYARLRIWGVESGVEI